MISGKQKENIIGEEIKILKDLNTEFPGFIKEVSVKGKKVFPASGEEKIRNLIDFVE